MRHETHLSCNIIWMLVECLLHLLTRYGLSEYDMKIILCNLQRDMKIMSCDKRTKIVDWPCITICCATSFECFWHVHLSFWQGTTHPSMTSKLYTVTSNMTWNWCRVTKRQQLLTYPAFQFVVLHHLNACYISTSACDKVETENNVKMMFSVIF